MLLALIVLHIALQAALAFLILRYKDSISYKRIIALVLFGLLAGWTFRLSDSAFILKHFPNAYAFVLYDLFPILVTAILALLTAARPANRLRYGVYGVLWLAMNVYFFSAAVYIPIRCGNEWSGVCCLQTDSRTCGAAAAATLLKVHGIDTTEDEMKSACLTSLNGTSFWGLYHGLSTRAGAAGMGVEVEDFSCDEFLMRNQPAIVWVMLTPEMDARDKRYAGQWGWTVNVSHAVVFLGVARDGRLRIADPKIGVELWHPIGLHALWRNKVAYIKSRARQ